MDEKYLTPYDYEKVRDLVRPYGKMATRGLFYGYEDGRANVKPMFNLSDWRKAYVEIADPTEYAAAMFLIGNWEHWLAIRENPTMKKIIDEWQQEMEISVRSLGVRAMMSTARGIGPGSAAAARWLAEGGFIEDKRLRTKEGKKKEQDVKDAVKDRTASDAARLNLVANNG